MPRFRWAVARPINNIEKCRSAENFEMGPDPNWRPSASDGHRRGKGLRRQTRRSAYSRPLALPCRLRGLRTWPAENHQLVATTLTQRSSHRERCVARISPSQTVGPSLISLNNSRHSTVALKTRRARLLCRAANPPSNQLMRICGFKSAIGEP
jgi:hypothetical protein